ncbi:hypothetical protein [Streptomyces sp. Pv4-95]|uniref:hypothetical protein n=1 Tax=Streptomyces sp. Pv4-95 TaxID=3049543 RepID=UPI003892059C
MTEVALRSVGKLLRRVREANAAIAVDTRVDWPRDLADPEGGTMLCHDEGARTVGDLRGQLRPVPSGHTELPGVIEQTTAACRTLVADRVADGEPTYVPSHAEHGGWRRWDRIQEWLTANREAFSTALQD